MLKQILLDCLELKAVRGVEGTAVAPEPPHTSLVVVLLALCALVEPQGEGDNEHEQQGPVVYGAP